MYLSKLKKQKAQRMKLYYWPKKTKKTLNLLNWKLLKKSENHKLKHNNDRLTLENNQVKQQSNNNENYSRHKNVVIRGISEQDNETNVMCEEETRTFMCEKVESQRGDGVGHGHCTMPQNGWP